MHTLETERLILRPWRQEDLKPFARMNADHMIMEYYPRRLTEQDTEKLVGRFEKHFRDHGYGPYALENKETGEFIGFAGLQHVEPKLPFAPAVEIAWRLDYGFWGAGFATEASRAVLSQSFGELGLKEIVAYAVYDNTRAIHIMEKLGMQRDSKGDFDYPGLKKDHPLGRFVLYRINSKAWRK